MNLLWYAVLARWKSCRKTVFNMLSYILVKAWKEDTYMEKERIFHLFDNGFTRYKNVPIALYGLGINTKYLLEEAKEYNIIGIAANERIGEIVYEHKVMPIEAIPGKGEIIVIIAQAKSIKTIYERIKHIENSGVEIYDIYGKKLKNYYNEESPKMGSCLPFESVSVMSAYERILYSSVANVVKHAVNKCDCTILHLFSSKAFKNPLSLVESNGRLKIDNMYELGYYCFAPITVKFLTWLVSELENVENSIILFSSRDGYLLFKLYQLLKGKNPELKLPEAKYFYISRRAATVACIQKESDIVDIVTSVLSLSMGSLRQILEQRLGIALDNYDPILNRSLTEILGEKDKNRIVGKVLEYKTKILTSATVERMNYLKYLQSIDFNSNNNICFFDLYTRGTNVTKLGYLLDKDIKLFCYAVKDFPNEYIHSTSKYESMFDSTNMMSGECFRRGYQLFEIVYASPEGQLGCFDKDGVPQFIENSQYNHSYIKEAQKGILAFINDLDACDDKWYRNEFSLAMTDFMSGMMAQRYSVVSPEIHNGFIYQDSFSSDETINIWDRIV